MKYWSLITLLIFLNFTVLPAVASALGWDISIANVILNEEEQHPDTFIVYEKTIPKILDILDYLKFCGSNPHKKTIVNWEIFPYASPFLSTFSPPPEILSYPSA